MNVLPSSWMMPNRAKDTEGEMQEGLGSRWCKWSGGEVKYRTIISNPSYPVAYCLKLGKVCDTCWCLKYESVCACRSN